jgi:hypothetical protein
MNNESHSIAAWYKEDHKEEVHAFFFEERVHDVGAEGLYSFVDELVALEKRDARSYEEERPAIRDVHWVQHQVKKIHVLLSIGEN